MDPRDAETAKWLGEVIDAGDSPASSTNFLPTAGVSHSQDTTASTVAVAKAEPRSASSAASQPSAARLAAKGATQKNGLLAQSREARASVRQSTTTITPSASRNTLTSVDAAQRASRLAAGAANEALYRPTPEETHRVSRMSSAGAAASLAAEAHHQTPKPSKARLDELALERNAAGRAAILAARDSSPYEIPEHALSANAGKAALLAHKDHVEYEVPNHELSANAGKAALLAHHDHVEYEVPNHELSANAGKAALLAHHDHVEYEVPQHELSANAGKAALLAHHDHKEYEVPVHQLSASASNAALQAHADHREYEVPVHEMSANAGKAALLAHHDHKEYEVPHHELSANAGKAALLAHRDTVSAPSRPNSVSAASAANALKAASQAHHDPAMRPTKPEDLQAKGAANALKAASQAHHEAPPPFKYVHPSDDPAIGKLARSNTQSYLAEMEPRAPEASTVRYANLSYSNAKNRQSQADEYRLVSEDAYRSAGLAAQNDAQSLRTQSTTGRPRTDTASTVNRGPVDLMALARRNVDAQMAERGLSRTVSEQTVSTVGAANKGANLAFRDGRERQVESDRQRELAAQDEPITERIAREMAQFDRQRKKNQDSGAIQSALMAAAKRNARASMAQMDANMPYSAPNLRDTQRLEDLLNDQKLAARRETSEGAMVDIGGGHYMSQVEIEAVAARRVQPVFDEMDEHVAEINRRKAEIEARRKEDQARKEAEVAERRKQRELEKERERNTKEAEKKAKAEAKAKKAAEKAELERQRKEAAEAKREEERTRREEALIAERQRAEEAKLQREQETERAAELKRTGSAEAVATAGVVHTAPRTSTSNETPLPGTNAALPGQELTREGDLNQETAPPAAAVAVVPATTTASTTQEPELTRTTTTDSLNEPVATYQIDNRGMVTDTEGETDDEWADAMEETPAIERAEYISVGHRSQLTNDNLATRGPIREESTEDVETASISTARPADREVEVPGETAAGTVVPATTSATTDSSAAVKTVDSDAFLPKLGRVLDTNSSDEELVRAPVVGSTAAPSATTSAVPTSHGHEQTRFKEELS